MQQHSGMRLLAGLGVLLLVTAGFFADAGPAPLSTAAAAEQWVQARWQSRTDKTGFPFTPDMHGRVQAQFGYLYSGYTFNNSGMSIQKQQMKPNGTEYQIQGRAGNLVIKRRFRIDPKVNGVRVLEVVHNPGSKAVNTTLVVYTQHHWRSQQVVTDTGRNANGPMAKNEGGVICRMQGPMQALICYQLCGPRSKVKPNVVNQNNQNLQFHYNFQVPARSTVTISHGAVVLRNATMPSGRNMSRLFKEMRGRNWVRDLPRDIRSSIINGKTRGGFPGDGTIPSLEVALEVTPGTSDKLAFSEETLLQGTASCRSLRVHGSHGTAEVPFSRLAAIVGPRSNQRESAVYLRDGQRLTGRVEAEGLRFEMTSGMGIDLDIDKLDRLVMRDPELVAAKAAGLSDSDGPRELPKDAQPYFLVETFSGERLRAQRETETFGVATQWGELEVPVDELKGVHLAGAEDPGYWILLTDGSRFRAYLRGREISMKSDLFGAVRFHPREIQRIVSVRPKRPGDDEEEEMSRPHLVLAGGDMLVGHIDLDALHFLSPGGVVPQPPSQVKLLANEREDRAPTPGEPLRFRAEIWGGGHVTGELRELVVPFKTARGQLGVAVRDILEVHVPSPIVPQVLQQRLRALIQELGHASWEKREAASASLAEFGELARTTLEQSLRETKDPEVERRIRRLLDRL